MNNLKTYSVSLFFDEKGQCNLKKLISDVSQITGNNYMVINEVPPHITLGMFKACDEELKELVTIVEAVSKIPFEIKLKKLEIETFRNKLLVLKVDSYATEMLNLLNKKLHNQCLKKFSAGCNNLYMPGNFFPHIAIASGLTNVQMEKAICYMKDKLQNIELEIKRMSLAQRHPYKVIF